MHLKGLLEIIKERRSVREFTNEKVSDEDIRLLIDAARYAPSNSNRQAWKFIILKNDKIKSKIVDAVSEKIEKVKGNIQDEEHRKIFNDYTGYFLFFSQAPIVIFALYKTMPAVMEHVVSKINAGTKAKKPEPELVSVSMAVQNLLLASHAMGLGACCITSPLIASTKIKKILDIKPPFEIAALIPLGKYDKAPEVVGRKEIDKIIEIVE